MAASDASNLLDPIAISRAESLGLNARFIVEGYMAGEHKSPYRGFAVEFAQHREYTHGDDPRHLDWKVLGRTDRYYIKQYEQETNYVAHLLLDGSESMRYGSGKITKLHYGKMMAACLAYLILHQRDAAAFALFDTTVRDYTPRSDNLATIHNLMAKLAQFEPKEQTNIAAVLHDMARQIRRKGIVIVISDFFDDEQKVLDGIQHLRFGGTRSSCSTSWTRTNSSSRSPAWWNSRAWSRRPGSSRARRRSAKATCAKLRPSGSGCVTVASGTNAITPS
jgi:hypothetical protein